MRFNLSDVDGCLYRLPTTANDAVIDRDARDAIDQSQVWLVPYSDDHETPSKQVSRDLLARLTSAARSGAFSDAEQIRYGLSLYSTRRLIESLTGPLDEDLREVVDYLGKVRGYKVQEKFHRVV